MQRLLLSAHCTDKQTNDRIAVLIYKILFTKHKFYILICFIDNPVPDNIKTASPEDQNIWLLSNVDQTLERLVKSKNII